MGETRTHASTAPPGPDIPAVLRVCTAEGLLRLSPSLPPQRHMCEFYRRGWGFQKNSGPFKQTTTGGKPNFSASHRDGDSRRRSESGDWNLITALKPSESNMRERDETQIYRGAFVCTVATTRKSFKTYCGDTYVCGTAVSNVMDE